MHVVTDSACDSVVLVWDDRQGPAFSKTFLFIAARLMLVGSHHLGSMLVNGYGAAPGGCKKRGVDEAGDNSQVARRGERDRDGGGGSRRWGWGRGGGARLQVGRGVWNRIPDLDFAVYDHADGE